MKLQNDSLKILTLKRTCEELQEENRNLRERLTRVDKLGLSKRDLSDSIEHRKLSTAKVRSSHSKLPCTLPLLGLSVVSSNIVHIKCGYVKKA